MRRPPQLGRNPRPLHEKATAGHSRTTRSGDARTRRPASHTAGSRGTPAAAKALAGSPKREGGLVHEARQPVAVAQMLGLAAERLEMRLHQAMQHRIRVARMVPPRRRGHVVPGAVCVPAATTCCVAPFAAAAAVYAMVAHQTSRRRAYAAITPQLTWACNATRVVTTACSIASPRAAKTSMTRNGKKGQSPVAAANGASRTRKFSKESGAPCRPPPQWLSCVAAAPLHHGAIAPELAAEAVRA